jgi:hypothetical protein
MTEIAENMQEGLLALAVGAGLQVMQALMEADVTVLAGPKGRHDQARTAVRHGRERGSVTLGGRRVAVTRPRVRAADGCGELPVPSYELFTSTEILGKMALAKMLAGLSTRRYPVGLEPVGQQVTETSAAAGAGVAEHGQPAATGVPGLSVDGQRRVRGDEVLVTHFVPEVVGDLGVQRCVVFCDAFGLAGAGDDCGVAG